MTDQLVLNAEPREDVGKGASRRLRHADLVPAVIYGSGHDPINVEIRHDDLFHAQEEQAFYTSTLTIKVDGEPVKVRVQDIQLGFDETYFMGDLMFKNASNNDIDLGMNINSLTTNFSQVTSGLFKATVLQSGTVWGQNSLFLSGRKHSSHDKRNREELEKNM